MYGQLWIVWYPGCRKLISATGNSIWYIIISNQLFTGLLLLEEFLHGYMAVVGMLVLGNAFENTWLNVSKGVILGANGEWDQHALQNH